MNLVIQQCGGTILDSTTHQELRRLRGGEGESALEAAILTNREYADDRIRARRNQRG